LRWAEDLGTQFQLSEEQRKQVGEDVVQRWTRFLKENRGDLQPLLNEFVEMRMELRPPPKERVRDWSKKAVPVFEKVRRQLDEGAADFRKVLQPGQEIKFEAENLKFRAGLLFAERRLKQWQSGDFDENDFWEPTRAERRKRRVAREERAEANADARPQPAPKEDPITEEVKAWEAYVQEFVKQYHLDESQKTTALSCLTELKDRAMSHRDLRRDDIAKLEERIGTHSGTDSELADLRIRLTELYGPVDEMFQELKRRLEAIPTDAQRETAEKKKEKS
jgi:hypothetical protein